MKTILLSALILISIDSIKTCSQNTFQLFTFTNEYTRCPTIFSRRIKLFYSSCSQQSNGCFYTWIGYLWRI